MRMVLLLHELPEGTRHFDWLVEQPGAVGLLSFRVADRIGASGFDAERIADHRREYLSYEGEVSGGRGRVQRVAEGTVDRVEISEVRVAVSGWLGSSQVRMVGRRIEGVRWRFEPSVELP